MNVLTAFIALACLAAAWHLATIVIIYENLRRRGHKVSFIWLRVMGPWYAHRYKEITKSETGKVGPLFYHWIVSINTVLLFVILVFIVHYV